MPGASLPSLERRILSRLEQAESREPNPHLQTDIRIAWITVLNAARGTPQAHVFASYAVLGVHPAEVWPQIVARRRALLGVHYAQFFEEDHGAFLSLETAPKKPARSARSYPQPAARAG
jgi:hypothetical protein